MKPILFCRLTAGILLLCRTMALAQPYTVTTIAGSAINPGTVDGTNSAAAFTAPAGLALDSSGTVFVTDGDSLRTVTNVGTNWVVQTVLGIINIHGFVDGTNSVVRFNDPWGVAADAAGNLYVADTKNNAIRKVFRAGTNWMVTTIAGPAPQFNAPSGSADGTNNSARFNRPISLAVDSATNIYVADTSNQTVRAISPLGTNWVVTTIAGSVGSAGSADGTNSNARFSLPNALVADPSGNLFVADFGNNCIRKMSRSGTNWIVTTFAGSTNAGSADGMGTNARFNAPQYVALDSTEHLFVADFGNSTIRRISPAGLVTTVAGMPGVSGSSDGTGSAAHFGQPYGIGLNSSGTVFLADFSGYAVRQAQLAPILQIGRNGHQVVVSWPLGLTNYGLRVTPQFNPPAWSGDISTGIALMGDWWTLTNASPGFYRLRHP
ncbi:MAG: hypothetical protein C5B50_04900 [Verrucomicrobia bacterium]|nr:MAG: hypothetical protein C5B50_04900 [Verrucomicrobiota bacterium]